MRPAIVMPMHDPAGILFPHLKRAMPDLKQAFARGHLSVTAVTLAQQPSWAAWLDGEPFFDLLTGSDAARPGDQFAALYRHAAAVNPPEQPLHLGFVDRVVYALGSEYRQAYLDEAFAPLLAETPRLYHRSTAAWTTHPANYRAMEGSITTTGEALLGRSLDFAWCYMTLTAARLAQLMPSVTRSDMSMLAEMVLGLCDELQVVEVDWLAWEDPYLLGRDAAELKRERDASPAEMRKRLGYVIPMLQVLAGYNGGKMNPYVKSVAPLDEYRLEILFENGERRVFDAKPYLYRGAFTRLQDRALFSAARVVAGSVEWPGGVDLSYDTLYLESTPVKSTATKQTASA